MTDTNTANPEVAEPTQEEVTDAIFGSDSSSFFADLDQQVNGSVLEPEQAIETEEVTQAPQEVGNPDSIETNNVDYEKRYKDSSREAQKLKAKLDEVEPFMPILNRLNEDADMVEVVNRGTNVPRNTRAPSVADTAAFLLMVKSSPSPPVESRTSPPRPTHTSHILRELRLYSFYILGFTV